MNLLKLVTGRGGDGSRPPRRPSQGPPEPLGFDPGDDPDDPMHLVEECCALSAALQALLDGGAPLLASQTASELAKKARQLAWRLA